ncbi:MAG: Arc family DNA-binding protein [Gemmatimonadetes bacterium]|nr:Arc family DNA-binding protein [Gemmatimonadota bacterium]
MATLNIKNLPDELYAQLKERAKREHRSVSQEVVHLLTRALRTPPAESLRDLRGVARGVYGDVDAYLEEERASWD